MFRHEFETGTNKCVQTNRKIKCFAICNRNVGLDYRPTSGLAAPVGAHTNDNFFYRHIQTLHIWFDLSVISHKHNPNQLFHCRRPPKNTFFEQPRRPPPPVLKPISFALRKNGAQGEMMYDETSLRGKRVTFVRW